MSPASYYTDRDDLRFQYTVVTMREMAHMIIMSMGRGSTCRRSKWMWSAHAGGEMHPTQALPLGS
ncbi:hypothetical protein GOC72_26420 [Sinorhizobium medicae]|nr:hypothetical protein [Sinorhizobium medicae]MDX0516666.1 hypothetical protein [Sinorhizobium medicae]MDX0726032.1 hypothetical protein [Sinorhizobium medicae]MDX0732391.1 hypothetical protein [Sinorhizobium medicae]MDX0813726.1 hypothetical protein [Sinorhizobium medicae]